MPAVEENRWTLPLLLSFTAGYVDTVGFLALQGLFTAHVTGNFVTLVASLALGASGPVAKLLALPVFCAVVIAVRILSLLLSRQVRAGAAAVLFMRFEMWCLGATDCGWAIAGCAHRGAGGSMTRLDCGTHA
jgi:uncharacterized membrane protein YoaK (UPF0700 family)